MTPWPKLEDAIARLTAATSATAAAVFRVNHWQTTVLQVVSNASAAGSFYIAASLDGTDYPVIKTVTVSASSLHMIWLESPVAYLKLDPSGLSAGSISVKTAGTRS